MLGIHNLDLEEKVLEKFNYEIPNFLKIHFDLENPNEFTTIHKFSRKVMVKTAFIIVNR